jgi:hypothetical protein
MKPKSPWCHSRINFYTVLTVILQQLYYDRKIGPAPFPPPYHTVLGILAQHSPRSPPPHSGGGPHSYKDVIIVGPTNLTCCWMLLPKTTMIYSTK